MPVGGVVRWTFDDLGATPEHYELEVNPKEGGSLLYSKNTATINTTAPGGRTLIFEGGDQPLTLEWSGVLLSEEQHERFVDWWDKRHQFLLTDDLGRQYMIYITEYTPKRERSVEHRWKHSYSVKATILDWITP